MPRCLVEGDVEGPSGGRLWARFSCRLRALGQCPLDYAGDFPTDIPQDVKHLSPSNARAIGKDTMRRMLPAVRDACNMSPRPPKK